MIYESIIIGGGPAGCAASIYCARKKIKTLLIAESFGGQSLVSTGIGNWIGDIELSGYDLAQRLEAHVRAQDELQIVMPERVEKILVINSEPFPVYEVITNKARYQSYSVIVCSGGRRRKLGVLGEREFDGLGVAYCSTCDAPFFRGQDVIVVGSGNSALEGVLDLNAYASRIYLFNRGSELRGDPKTREHIQELEKVMIMHDVKINEIYGDSKVRGVKYLDKKTNSIKDLAIGGIFIEIGSIPNSELLGDLVNLNDRQEIIVDHQYFTTSRAGIFAAGDVTDQIYKQNNISVGEAICAALTCYDYIQKMRKLLGIHI